MSKQTDEKRELLKMKQGLIEESDIIEQDVHNEFEKPKGIKAVEHFLYTSKWYLIAGIFIVVVLVFVVYQTATKEAADMTVLVVTSDVKKTPNLYQKTNDIELALEQYCPDYDNNGNVHVDVYYIDATKTGSDLQYISSNSTKLFGEMQRGQAQLFICDKLILGGEEDSETTAEEYFDNIFLDLGKVTGNAVYNGQSSIKLGDTPFAAAAKWENSCPESLGFSIRIMEDGFSGYSSSAVTRNQQAQEVLNNIVSGNVINPVKTSQ